MTDIIREYFNRTHDGWGGLSGEFLIVSMI
jgi:hypothetical protein